MRGRACPPTTPGLRSPCPRCAGSPVAAKCARLVAVAGAVADHPVLGPGEPRLRRAAEGELGGRLHRPTAQRDLSILSPGGRLAHRLERLSDPLAVASAPHVRLVRRSTAAAATVARRAPFRVTNVDPRLGRHEWRIGATPDGPARQSRDSHHRLRWTSVDFHGPGTRRRKSFNDPEKRRNQAVFRD